ncbi:hypothetical protein D5F01_LYC24654 [Larimichthys crocea]|uniref:Uncharacterized protein n=1 Tax=Larimichthys crocea TaxID=215358 RepID=A0A6G0HEF1_LARCR|nr:hypothetical protein D5F01_LYC24654 [Larimichthys crocea]
MSTTRPPTDPILGGLAIPLPNMNSQVHLDLHCKGGEKGQLQGNSNAKGNASPESAVGDTVSRGSCSANIPTTTRSTSSTVPAPSSQGWKKVWLFVEEPEPTPVDRPIRPKPTSSTYIQPKPAASTYEPPAVSAAPVLLVLPAQPQAPSIIFHGPSCSQSFVPVAHPPAPTTKPYMPNKSLRPCGACHVHQCGGKRQNLQGSSTIKGKAEIVVKRQKAGQVTGVVEQRVVGQVQDHRQRERELTTEPPPQGTAPEVPRNTAKTGRAEGEPAEGQNSSEQSESTASSSEEAGEPPAGVRRVPGQGPGQVQGQKLGGWNDGVL